LDAAGDDEEGKRDASRNEGVGKKIDEEASCLSLKTKQRQEGNRRRSFTKTKKKRLRHIN
jgi:hypothetical protein